MHEILLLLFRNRPELAPELLREALHVELPPYSEVRLESAELSDVVPTEYRADLVVLLVDGKPVLGIVVEVQLIASMSGLGRPPSPFAGKAWPRTGAEHTHVCEHRKRRPNTASGRDRRAWVLEG